jgi:hypothetical protein
MKSLRNYQRCGGGAAKEVFRIVNRPQRIGQVIVGPLRLSSLSYETSFMND